MPEKFTFGSTFDFPGSFWLPQAPQDKFSGHLIKTDRGIELSEGAKYHDTLDVNEFSALLDPSPERIPTLLGHIEDGPCTLFQLQRFSRGTGHFPSQQSLTFRRGQASSCILGMHLPDISTPALKSACFRYTELKKWIPVKLKTTDMSDSMAIEHPKEIEVFDITIEELRTRLILRLRTCPTAHPMGEYEVTHDVQLMVESIELQSVEWMVTLAYRLENFFSLILGTSATLSSIELHDQESRGWFTRNDPRSSRTPDPLLWLPFEMAKPRLPGAVTSWLSSAETFRGLESLVYGTPRTNRLSVQAEFLFLAQAIESFHRVTARPLKDVENFAAILKALNEQIDLICPPDSDLNKRLRESIEHADEPNFRTRIKDLLGRLSENRCKALLGDKKEFEITLRQTRNHLTHLGIQRQRHVLVGTLAFFEFSQKLGALVRMLMLLNLGFPEGDIFPAIFNQARMWR